MKKPSKLARSGSTWGLMMVAPTIIGLLILNIVPLFQTIYMSFSKTKAFGAYEFCGFANYMEMFQTPEFWKATWNSVYTEFYSDCGFSPNPGHIHLQRDFRWIPVPRNIPVAVSEIIGSAASVYRMETEATVRIFDMWASRC